jgi:hypothetical protein
VQIATGGIGAEIAGRFASVTGAQINLWRADLIRDPGEMEPDIGGQWMLTGASFCGDNFLREFVQVLGTPQLKPNSNLPVDARGGRVATDGWLDESELTAVELVRSLASLPVAAILYTDIERDGTEVGPNVAETRTLARDGGLPVIASGGVGTLSHLRALAGAEPAIAAAIVGRALHERRFSLVEAAAAAAGETGSA